MTRRYFRLGILAHGKCCFEFKIQNHRKTGRTPGIGQDQATDRAMADDDAAFLALLDLLLGRKIPDDKEESPIMTI